jgi:hypothetical protein
MRLLTLLLILAASLATPLVATAADVYVIANQSVDLQAGDVRDVYLGEKLFSGSVRLRPVDNAEAQETFLSSVMHMTGIAYATAWTKKAFRQGLTQPPMYSGDAEVIEFVRRNEGAVGYARSAPSGVKVLQKLAK